MSEQTLKELKDKVDLIDLKIDAIIKHFKIEIEKVEQHIGLPAESIIKGLKKWES